MLRCRSAGLAIVAAVFATVAVVALLAGPAEASVPLSLPTKTARQSAKLPPCKLCTTLTESFAHGMERTARGKHDGGDAAWEEKKLGSYRRSELRLVEIQEALCKDAPRGEDQCHELAETSETLLEEWWQQRPDDTGAGGDDVAGDLHRWLCIDRLAVCCPPDTFGPECRPCADCAGNGKCKGAGTRKGNGKCACDTGYRGDACGECDQRYYESFRDETKLLCSLCHVACATQAGCTGAGPKSCRVCKEGWSMQPELGGCVDVDECSAERARCKANQFCVNNEGSFTCLECDRSCSGCSGDGPDECLACAAGFELREGLCKDLTNERREQYSTYMRYFTYLGLCFATCVIFQSSVYAASAIGLAVALYISLAEYYLYLNPGQKEQPNQGLGALQQLVDGGSLADV